MGLPQDIICIGAALWDVIGRADVPMHLGDDCPGPIRRSPGGVALNIARALALNGMNPRLLSAIGRDPEGTSLITYLDQIGVDTRDIHRPEGVATDSYMAIESVEGLIAALADTAALDAAGTMILAPLLDTPFWTGRIVLDGNLSASVIGMIAQSPAFGAADIRVASAAPAKAARLQPLLACGRASFYLNRAEAAALCQHDFSDSAEAACALVSAGAVRAIVTEGAGPVCDADASGWIRAVPPKIMPARVTGAGDAFMAAHIVAEVRGAVRADALAQAIEGAARHVETPFPIANIPSTHLLRTQ